VYDVSSHKEYTEQNIHNPVCKNTDDQLYGKVIPIISKTHKDPLPTSDITPPTPEHELVYCFAKKSPGYDVSSHKEYYEQTVYHKKTGVYGDKKEQVLSKVHKDPLPTSDITPPTTEHELVYCFAKKSPVYDVSSHKEYYEQKINKKDSELWGKKDNYVIPKVHKDPLPTSDITPPTTEHELVYCFAKKSPVYDVSSHKEYVEVSENRTKPNCQLYGEDRTKTHKLFKDPLPTSDITPPELDPNGKSEIYGIKKTGKRNQGKKDQDPLPNSDITPPSERTDNHYGLKSNKPGKCHKDPLPNSDITPSSWCEFKNDEKTGHRTAKPVALMEFLLKYWTKPDATVLDPTMGSGSMGIACKNMGRKFIGIEMDKDIYDLAIKRIG
jgi:nucleoside 2-deoxyribosyltransferase